MVSMIASYVLSLLLLLYFSFYVRVIAYKSCMGFITSIFEPDRQTDRYFIDRNKSQYRLICNK